MFIKPTIREPLLGSFQEAVAANPIKLRSIQFSRPESLTSEAVLSSIDIGAGRFALIGGAHKKMIDYFRQGTIKPQENI